MRDGYTTEDVDFFFQTKNFRTYFDRRFYPTYKIDQCNFDGVRLIQPSAYQDHRGYYYTIYDDVIDSKNNYVKVVKENLSAHFLKNAF